MPINPIILPTTRYFRYAYPPTRDNIICERDFRGWIWNSGKDICKSFANTDPKKQLISECLERYYYLHTWHLKESLYLVQISTSTPYGVTEQLCTIMKTMHCFQNHSRMSFLTLLTSSQLCDSRGPVHRRSQGAYEFCRSITIPDGR
jgi:hypothetical protein